MTERGSRFSLSFRAQLTLIIGTTAVGLLMMLAVSSLAALEQRRELQDLEGRLVPRLETGPRLQSTFEHLRQSMQDAVAAQDLRALDASLETKNQLLRLIGEASAFIPPAQSVPLQAALADYYSAAHDVSRRLIQAEAGEAIVEAMTELRAKHLEAQRLLDGAARLDRDELAQGFAAVRASNRELMRDVIVIGAGCLISALLLALWFARSALGALNDLSDGFARFALEDFSQPIPVRTSDQLGEVATAANRMAAALRRNADERERAEWIRAGIVGLAEALQTDTTPREAAMRALAFLCKYLNAPAGLFYSSDESHELHVIARYGAFGPVRGSNNGPAHARGLVEQASRNDELLVLDDVPREYWQVESGLGGTRPRTLLLLPLAWRSRVVGVIELGLLESCPERCRQLLAAVREPLAVKLDALLARQLERDLLVQTQEQAERLAVQEEELRTNNAELSIQQTELRDANLELETQRSTLSQQNSELEKARASLQEKALELEKVSTYKSRFLANMSHELRTPLNSMLLLSHMLSENAQGNLSEKQVEYAQTIHTAGRDLLGLINQVLDLAKIEAGRQTLDVETIVLGDVASHMKRSFEPLANDKGLELVVQLDPQLPRTIVSDRQRLERILINLIGNAIKFTTRGSVALRIAPPAPGVSFTRPDLTREECVAFSVSDTGIGIEPGDQDRIFAPFEQVESRSDRRYGGTGLGLAIARETAVMLGGELVLSSERDRGSVFTLHLPKLAAGAGRELDRPRPAQRGAPAAPARPAPPLEDDHQRLQSGEPHLLVIEDDRVFSGLLVELTHRRDFKVVVAATGEEGLRLARELKPVGIVLDVRLPDISGWEVMERLRQDPITRTIPVHIVSAVDAPERGLALGAVGYLTKPATRSELMGVVQRLKRPTTLNSRRILLVEDDADEGQSLFQLLERAGLQPTLCNSAEAALAELEQDQFCCMILDLGLPRMDGLQLLESLQARSDLSCPPVIVNTGRNLTREETRRIEAYARAIVLKDGCSKERLIDEVRAFVERLHASHSEAPRPAPREIAPEVSLEGKKILVAEDDMRTVYALSALLQGKGAQVFVAETGREALDVLAREPGIHGVLMDIMMPEMDGYEAMRQLRAQACFADLPVIALTAKAMKGERELCLQVGASDYLAKPVDPVKLLTKLGAWLTQGAERVS